MERIDVNIGGNQPQSVLSGSSLEKKTLDNLNQAFDTKNNLIESSEPKDISLSQELPLEQDDFNSGLIESLDVNQSSEELNQANLLSQSSAFKAVNENEDINQIKDNIPENHNSNDVSELKQSNEANNIFFKLPLMQNGMFDKLERNTNLINSAYNLNQAQKEYNANEPKTYAKIIADYVFLLGRLTTKPITDINGNVIIPKNTLVTAEVVLKAFNQGKLLDLTRYSKT